MGCCCSKDKESRIQIPPLPSNIQIERRHSSYDSDTARLLDPDTYKNCRKPNQGQGICRSASGKFYDPTFANIHPRGTGAKSGVKSVGIPDIPGEGKPSSGPPPPNSALAGATESPPPVPPPRQKKAAGAPFLPKTSALERRLTRVSRTEDDQRNEGNSQSRGRFSIAQSSQTMARYSDSVRKRRKEMDEQMSEGSVLSDATTFYSSADEEGDAANADQKTESPKTYHTGATFSTFYEP